MEEMKILLNFLRGSEMISTSTLKSTEKIVVKGLAYQVFKPPSIVLTEHSFVLCFFFSRLSIF